MEIKIKKSKIPEKLKLQFFLISLNLKYNNPLLAQI